MGQHRAGGKITHSHTTLIDAAVSLVDLAQVMPEVSKISLGIIKQIGKGPPSFKFLAIQGGWKVVVRGNMSLQDLYIYTSDPMKTKRLLES